MTLTDYSKDPKANNISQNDIHKEISAQVSPIKTQNDIEKDNSKFISII